MRDEIMDPEKLKRRVDKFEEIWFPESDNSSERIPWDKIEVYNEVWDLIKKKMRRK